MATNKLARKAAPLELKEQGAVRLLALATLLRRGLLYFLLTVGAVISLFPFYYMFMAATLPRGEVLARPPHLLPQTSLWDNVSRLVDDKTLDLVSSVWNSILIALIYTVVGVFLSALAGYAFAKYRWIGRNLIFAVFLATMMIPTQVTYIPLFKIMSGSNPLGINWLGTIQAIILPGLASPFGIFLMRQSMQSLPDELIDAGRIDGAGEFSIFWRIALPVIRPTLAALAIFMFMSQWNNFFWPLVAQVKTIPTRIGAMVGSNVIDYSGLMTLTSISVLPILIVFLIMQREFISGALAGSVKG